MKKTTIAAITTTAVAIGCATTPTGRKALHLLPDDQLSQMGASAFTQMKQQQPVNQNPAVHSYVRCVVGALIEQLPDDVRNGNKWEVEVFEDETPNAFALPGGKVGVHTGIMKVATTDAQLAAVLGHELGHVMAKHGNERVSQQLAAEGGLALISAIASTSDPEKAKKRQLIIGLLGAGAQVGILLPFSRTQESEADTIGLDLMARAGFDPQQSVALWKNMEAASGGQPPEFLSTHPSHGTRIEGLTSRMPVALAAYQEARRAGRDPRCAREAPIAAN